MKKVLATVLTVMLLALSAGALASPPTIEKLEYEGNGFIEIDFRGDVSYQDPRVSVQNAAGTTFSTEIYELDDDDLTFRATGLNPGETYEITVTGVRSGYSGSYETITAQITLPAEGVPSIKKVEYDADDRELEIEFTERVDFSNVQVEITDLNGTSYQAQIRDTDKDGLELRVDGLTRGETYLVKVVGVSLRGMNSYQTASMEFIARDD